jgi:hypothetical protein
MNNYTYSDLALYPADQLSVKFKIRDGVIDIPGSRLAG